MCVLLIFDLGIWLLWPDKLLLGDLRLDGGSIKVYETSFNLIQLDSFGFQIIFCLKNNLLRLDILVHPLRIHICSKSLVAYLALP